jgi:putative tryptophan/tyrosine transport system substrate-binding protein
MRANAIELIGLAPDLIAVNGTAVWVLQQQTRTIPIVVAWSGDVFANGLVKNLAHPEGNITGVTNYFRSTVGKWVELLKEAVPRLERVGFIYNPELEQLPSSVEPYSQQTPAPEVEKASQVLAVRTTAIPFRSAVDLVRGIDAFAAEPDGGLVIAPHVIGSYRATINTLAIQYRLPTIYASGGTAGLNQPLSGSPVKGGLILYAARETDIVLRAASFVDRILRGAKPGDLPVEFPTRFELVVNLKTAKEIGVTIPEAFLLRADEVIE